MAKPRKLKGTKKGDIYCNLETGEDFVYDGTKWKKTRG
jgi:hypothetical protein